MLFLYFFFFSPDVTSNYDYVFLCGDLNFRINKSREDVLDFVSKTWGETSPVDFRPELSKLLEADQLKLSLANSRGTMIHHFMCTHFYSKENVFCFYSDRILRTFSEAEITFAPTYKYIPGTENFDEAKQRVPS